MTKYLIFHITLIFLSSDFPIFMFDSINHKTNKNTTYKKEPVGLHLCVCLHVVVLVSCGFRTLVDVNTFGNKWLDLELITFQNFTVSTYPPSPTTNPSRVVKLLLIVIVIVIVMKRLWRERNSNSTRLLKIPE